MSSKGKLNAIDVPASGERNEVNQFPPILDMNSRNNRNEKRI